MVRIRRKCFISYHHADQNEVLRFINTFDHNHDLFIYRGLGLSMEDDIINSTNTDYVMSQIRKKYLKDSSVTLLMLGKYTWARRYVDWELQSSLRRGETTTPNGLLAIKLPSFPNDGSFPDRLNSNLTGTDACFARHIQYPTNTNDLVNAIERAYERRTTHARYIVNSRERMSYNRTCE